MSGSVTHTSASGCPFLSVTRPAVRCISSTVPAGASVICVRIVCVRTSGPRSSLAPDSTESRTT